jgi:hypothetical protein
MASQARHELVSPQEMFAARTVVPRLRRTLSHSRGRGNRQIIHSDSGCGLCCRVYGTGERE